MLILSFILGLFPVLPAEAGGKPGSDTEAELIHDDKTGEDYLTFTLTATTATHSIKWRSIGFYLTKNTTGREGRPESKASKSYFPLRDGWKKSHEKGDYTISTFQISMSTVENCCKAAGIDPYDGNDFYMQAVIIGVQGNQILTYPCWTVHDIQSTRTAGSPFLKPGWTGGIGWRNTCDADWRDRHDILVRNKLKPQKVKIKIYKYDYKSKTYTWCETRAYEVPVDSNGKLKKKITPLKGFHNRLEEECPGKGFSDKTKDYYLYKTSWSYLSDKKSADTGVPLSRATQSYWGDILDVHGEQTSSYKSAASSHKNRTFEIKRDKGEGDQLGYVVNVYYRNTKLPEEDDKEIIRQEDMMAIPSGIIQSDIRHNETFDSEDAIPTTEPQYVNVFCKSFLYKYEITGHIYHCKLETTKKNNSGNPVYVSKKYKYYTVFTTGVV